MRVLIAGIHAPPEVTALAGDGIEVLGAVPDLGEEMQRAAVILAPVRSGGGMRMKVLHALAAGKAVVTTPLGARGLERRERTRRLPSHPTRRGSPPRRRSCWPTLPDATGSDRAARAYAEQRYGPDAYAARLEAVYAEAVALRAAGEGAR